MLSFCMYLKRQSDNDSLNGCETSDQQSTSPVLSVKGATNRTPAKTCIWI